MKATYRLLQTCTNNPSTEFPKYIKRCFGMDREFKILDRAGHIYIAHHLDEFEVLKNNEIKKLQHGLSLTPFHVTTWVGYHRKRRGYYLHGKDEKIFDITEKFITAYLKDGMCSYSESHHEEIQESPRVRKCKFCGAKFKAKTVIKKSVEWVKLK